LEIQWFYIILGWATDLSVGKSDQVSSECSLLRVSVTLTPLGLKHTDEIVYVVFQYLAMMKTKGPQEWLFKEAQQLAAMKFHWIEKQEPLVYTRELSECMQVFPPKDVLTGLRLLRHYDPELLESVLDSLTPYNMRYEVYY
jgi:insulysin